MKIKNLKIETFEDDAKLVEKFGQGCNYSTGDALDGYQVDFYFTIGDSEKQFWVSYQSIDRTDSIMAYNGYEMGRYQDDDYCSIEETYSYDDAEDISAQLKSKATILSEKYLDRLIYEAEAKVISEVSHFGERYEKI